jgi:hypothetical protein
MKKAALIISVVIATGGGLLLFWQDVRPSFTLYHQYVEDLTLPDQPTFNGFPKLVAAVKSYLHDHISRGQPLPASVTFGDLVSGGYISTNDVRDFDGMDATFYPMAGVRDPKAVVVRVRTSNGRQIIVLADGSVQQLPR